MSEEYVSYKSQLYATRYKRYNGLSDIEIDMTSGDYMKPDPITSTRSRYFNIYAMSVYTYILTYLGNYKGINYHKRYGMELSMHDNRSTYNTPFKIAGVVYIFKYDINSMTIEIISYASLKTVCTMIINSFNKPNRIMLKSLIDDMLDAELFKNL